MCLLNLCSSGTSVCIQNLCIVYFLFFKGSTTYVLSYHQGVYQLWNAHTGEKFSVNDAYCPLQNIACLINSENVSICTNNLVPVLQFLQRLLFCFQIWANVQQSGQPYRMSFDLTKAQLWRPFFTKKYPNPGLSSVQVRPIKHFHFFLCCLGFIVCN